MGCELVGFCTLAPEAQAAWAQAVLSFLGIAVAVAVPWKIKRDEDARQREIDSFNELRAAQAALPHLRDLRVLLAQFPAKWSRDRSTPMPRADHRRNLGLLLFRDSGKLAKMAHYAGPRLGIPLTLVAVQADRMAIYAEEFILDGPVPAAARLHAAGSIEDLNFVEGSEEMQRVVHAAIAVAEKVVAEAKPPGN